MTAAVAHAAAPQGFVARFREVAARQPGAPALVEGGKVALSYGELAARAHALGRSLRARGVGPESVVGLGLEKSAAWVLGMLGVWEAGAAFLPVDPGLPPARRARCLARAGAAWTLVARQADWTSELPSQPLEITRACAEPGSPEPPRAPPDPEALAYVIFSSGSTGEPKGILVPQRGLEPLLDAQIDAFRLRRTSRALWVLGTGFDASVSDVGTVLLAGATLSVGDAETLSSPARLLATLEREQITHVDLPPALLPLLDVAAAPASLETIVIGGEPCAPEAVRRWARRVRLVNVYGPTEATVCTSLCVCDPEHWQRPLLGSPLDHVRYRVLDAELREVPPGTPGELCIGGSGLARGYLGLPGRTAERFVTRDGERLFRTGDWVVATERGEWVFLGRLDRQIKLRGMLIAPEEVEARLVAHPAVDRAALLARRLGSRTVLVAFVELSDPAPSWPTLERHLAAELPDWMVPGRWVRLAALPETPSGKVDLQALARLPLAPDRSPRPRPEGLSAADSVVEQLARLFERVLGAGGVAPDDDFFALGGDSLAAIELLAAAECEGLPLEPESLAAHPTPAALAETLRSGSGEGQRGSADALRADASRFVVRRSARAAAGSPRAILLTGATGFLGSRLARELLARTRAPLLCLVRAADDRAATRRLRAALEAAGGPLTAEEAGRLEPLRGDIERPALGLAPSHFRLLCDQVDAVHHCAARLSLALPYAALRTANLSGTHELLELACAGRAKRFHHASSLAVFVDSDRDRGVALESDDLARTQWVYGGYAQSKFAAEWLVRRAAAAGLWTRIYRYGLLTGDVATGRLPTRDWLALCLRGLAALGCVPRDALDALALDVTPVDWAAAATAWISLAEDRGPPPETFHLAGWRGVRLREWVDALAAAGAELEPVGIEAFRARVRELAGERGKTAEAAACLALCRAGSEGSFARLRSLDLFQAVMRFDDRRARARLAGSGLTRPDPTAELLARYAERALEDRVDGGSR